MQNPKCVFSIFLKKVKPYRVWSRISILALGMLFVFMISRTFNHRKSIENQHHSNGDDAQSVRVARAVLTDVPVIKHALGTVVPLNTVVIRPCISGELLSLGFTEGQHVKRGDFLAQIDPRSIQTSLAQAEGNLLRDQALLEQAKKDLKRYKLLLSQDSIARQTYEEQISLVKQRAGVVKSDVAAVEYNRINLSAACIRSPINGRIGFRQIDVGNYIEHGDSKSLATIIQTKPISVIFTIPEDDINQVMNQLRVGTSILVSAFDRSNTHELAHGKVDSIDNQIDTSTGTVRLRANFKNASDVLFPNQFVNVRFLIDTLRDKVVIPSTALQNGPIGDFVYLLNKDNSVSVRKVKINSTYEEQVIITQGLNEGDVIVVEGVDHLQEGAKIRIPDGIPS